MTATTGALTAAGVLIAEEIIVGSRGGPGAVAGIFGTVASWIAKISSPTIAAIPNLADKKKG